MRFRTKIHQICIQQQEEWRNKKTQMRVLNKWKNGKESAEDVYMLKIMSKE